MQQQAWLFDALDVVDTGAGVGAAGQGSVEPRMRQPWH